jgi:hypothetical protein
VPIYGKAKKQKPNKGKKPGGGATARPGGPNRGGYAGAPPPSYAEGPYPSPAGPGYWQGPPRAIEPPGWDGPSIMPKLDMGGWGDPPLDPGSGPGDMPGMKPGPGGGVPIGDVGESPGGGGLPSDTRWLGGGDPLGMTRLMDRVRGGMPDMGGGAVGAAMDPLMMALLKLQSQR